MPTASITPTYIAARARDTANTIRQLPCIVREIAEADPCPTIEEVRRRLNPTKLEVDFRNVVLYVGRNWSLAHQDRLVMQVAKVAEGAEAFIAAVEEFVVRTSNGNAEGLRLKVDGFFVSVCLMVADEIHQWAVEIEARAGSQAGTSPGGGQGGKGAGQTERKPGLPSKSKRGKAKGLTTQQEAVVQQIEDLKLKPTQIAEQRGCSVQAVYTLYDRAKKNPGYKKTRSINLSEAKPLHANTRPKSGRGGDE